MAVALFIFLLVFYLLDLSIMFSIEKYKFLMLFLFVTFMLLFMAYAYSPYSFWIPFSIIASETAFLAIWGFRITGAEAARYYHLFLIPLMALVFIILILNGVNITLHELLAF